MLIKNLLKKEVKMISPLNDRVVVKGVNFTQGSTLVIPDIAKNKMSSYGRVFAVGPGNANTAMSVEKGDIVAFSPMNAAKIEVGKKKFLVLRIGEIICRIDTKSAGVDVEDIDY